jgi:hypothetical protein
MGNAGIADRTNQTDGKNKGNQFLQLKQKQEIHLLSVLLLLYHLFLLTPKALTECPNLCCTW